MTDLPYTDADLYAEAARQHHALTEDPDFMGVGEQMDGRRIPSTDDGLGGMGWDGLPDDHYRAAQRRIHDLINDAADVSEWAVQLGAAGLSETVTHGWHCSGRGWDLAVQIAHHQQIDPGVLDAIDAAVKGAVAGVLEGHGLTAYRSTTT